jgi:hypothetical protein
MIIIIELYVVVSPIPIERRGLRRHRKREERDR